MGVCRTNNFFLWNAVHGLFAKKLQSSHAAHIARIQRLSKIYKDSPEGFYVEKVLCENGEGTGNLVMPATGIIVMKQGIPIIELLVINVLNIIFCFILE